MLVLIMLSLFLSVMALSLTIYVVIRKNKVEKTFARKQEDDLENFDEDDEDEAEGPNIIMPNSFQNVILEENQNEEDDISSSEIVSTDEKIEVIEDNSVNNDVSLNDETLEEEKVLLINNDDEVNETSMIIENEIENNDVNNIQEIVEDLEVVKKERQEEVVNLLINKKNYIFLANNNHLEKNDHIKVVINNKIYFAVVTKANYYRDINSMKVKPRKLIIVKNKPKKVLDENISNNQNVENNELDFIPKKKKIDEIV